MHGSDTDQVTVARVPFALYRGGTSKAVFLSGSDLPEAPEARDRFILRLFGSPDPRQIDGLGGADLLTSKLAIIDPATRQDADVDYTFAQVSITEPVVDYDINCGNISAAVGAYAVDEGLVPASEPVTTVRIHNTNTGKVFWADVPVAGGRAMSEGTTSIDGVPGTGAAIPLDFHTTAGGATGHLIPTGRVTDTLDLASGALEVSIVDLAMLSVFFDAHAVGMTGTEAPSEVTDDHLGAVAEVKTAAARLLGMDPDGLVPVPVVVAPRAPFVSYATGRTHDASEMDLTSRVIGGRPPVLHKAYPGTVSACTAVAAMLEGSVVSRAAGTIEGDTLRIGHPSGIIEVRASVEMDRGNWTVRSAAYVRTARRLAEGIAHVPVAS